MKKILIPLTFLTGLFFLSALAISYEKVKYLWPVKENNIEVTSVFCDKRTGHPHGGIDISLFGKVGQTPIVSVGDGILMRIRDSKYGYGKAIYVLMQDKRVAVYAHLDGFSPKIREIARQLRRQTGLEKLDYYYEEWEMNVSIKKGELIGYGGNSGTSTAHLHFELRYDDMVNLNPLTNGFPIHDKISPIISSILLVPVNSSSTIEGATKPKTFFTSNLKKPIKIAGRVGIAVNAKDSHIKGGRSFSPYRIEIFIDNQDFFETKYERWGYIDQNIWRVQYDSDGRGNNLYCRAYNPYPVSIPFFSKSNGGTLDQLEPGIHEIRIEVSDANGNSDATEFQVDISKPDQETALPTPKESGKNILFNNTAVSVDSGSFSISGNEFSFFEPIQIDLSEIPPVHPEAVVNCMSVNALPFFARRPFNVVFSYGSNVTDPSQLGIYLLSENELLWLGNDIDLSNHTIAGSTESMGVYCMISDTQGPRISNVKLNPKSKTPIKFNVTDDISGLKRNFVLVTIDGKLTIVSFSPKTGKGSANIYWDLKAGYHTAVITAIDRAGNLSEKSLKFIITN